jgi:hypothetical protein
MDSLKRKTDQAFARKLRERFEDFQAPEKDGLSEKIFESIGIKPRRSRWLALVFIVFLLLLGLRTGIHFNKTHIKERKSVLRKTESGHRNAADNPTSSQIRKETPAKQYPSKTYKRDFATNAVDFIPSAELVESIASAADSNVATTFVHTDSNAVMLSGRDLHFSQLALPEIGFKDSSQTNKKPTGPKHSRFIPVFSVSGGQQFQIVNVHSDSELPFQNVQFAPLLTVRSMFYKVSAGIEKGSLQLLVTYGNMRTWNYYEVGTNRIEIDPAKADQYIQRRAGMPRIIDEKMHLLGLSARTALPLSSRPFRGMSTMAGLEFTTILPDPAIMLWANIRSMKNIHLNKKTDLAIGPYAEYSLSQRNLLGGRWQSRPYRIGLAVEIKFPGK